MCAGGFRRHHPPRLTRLCRNLAACEAHGGVFCGTSSRRLGCPAAEEKACPRQWELSRGADEGRGAAPLGVS